MDNCNKIKVILTNATIDDYYELERVFKSGNINAEILTKNASGAEMGFGFSELVVLLPLLTPFVIQFRKVLTAYWTYKKPLNKKRSVILECNGKKLKIESENDEMPSVDELMVFFGENTCDISIDGSARQGEIK